LLKLPPDIQIAVKENRITMGHARALINIENIDAQIEIFKTIIKNDLSVRKTEELVRNLIGVKSQKKGTPEHQSNKTNQSDQFMEIKALQQDLSSHFGTKVHIHSNSKNKGEIKIPFLSVEDLNRILEILNYR